MDGGRSGQVSIDVTDTFNDLRIIGSSWNQFICHWSSQFEQVIKMAQLLIAPKPSWTCSKEKRLFCDCWRSLGLCIPLTATSATFFCGGGSNPKFEGSSLCPMMTSRAVEDIIALILDKYICATAAIVKTQCNAFLLADCGNFEHFFTSLQTWN